MMSQKSKVKIVILAGNRESTNLKAIKKGVEEGRINAEISAVIFDIKELPLIEKIHPDFICLTGWKEIIPDDLIEKYPNKILNLHPGLIPDTPNGKVMNPDNTEALWNKGKFTEKAKSYFLPEGTLAQQRLALI